MNAAWILLMVGLGQAPEVGSIPAAASAEAPTAPSAPTAPPAVPPKVYSRIEGLPSLGLPGLVLRGGDADLRALFNEQLAAELEGAGFKLSDANALRAAGARIPKDGCLSVEPLCGAEGGVAQILLGRMRVDAEGIHGTFELREASTGRLLWRGSAEATDIGGIAAEFHRLAWETLPPVALQSPSRPTHRAAGLSTHQWGWVSVSAGTALAVGGGVLIAITERKFDRLQQISNRAEPVYPRDVVRWQQEIPRERIIGGVMLGAGATALIGGLVMLAQPPPGTPQVAVTMDGRGGALVFSGVWP